MIRIWGLLKPQCLPVFSSSADNLDILSTLFRALTRLALNPNEPDEVLLGEFFFCLHNFVYCTLNKLYSDFSYFNTVV